MTLGALLASHHPWSSLENERGHMLKFILFTLILIPLTRAHAHNCEVYGISDSPQSLTCSFKHLDVALRCKDGVYFLNNSKVSMAYHLEVEDGPTPLVFRAPDMKLTATMNSKTKIAAEVVSNGKTFNGSCR
jgi:hypothetical protein